MRTFTNSLRTLTKTLTLPLIILISSHLHAQNDADAFRYSGSSITGTGRFVGMSGAFGALGGDFSTIGYNPGGLGVYRSSEIFMSPSVFVGGSTSNYLGNSTDDSKGNFNFGNMGLVLTRQLSKDVSSQGWKSWSFAFGYNRVSNFHTRTYFEGRNNQNSLLDYFAQNAKGKGYADLDSYYEYPAYYTFLINPDSLNNYSSAIPAGGELQRRSFESRGSIGETTFGFGGNYSNKLFLGASLNFRRIRYDDFSRYEELDDQNIIDTLSRFTFEQDLRTRGSGANFKLGFIYKPSDAFRIGGAIHTPTWYTMQDNYNSNMLARFDSGAVKQSTSPAGAFDYELTTPFRAIAGVAFVIGKVGLVSADYEFTDYSQARLRSIVYGFSSENNNIRNKYTSTNNIRIGTEWRIDNLSLRAGAATMNSPINSRYRAAEFDFSNRSYSCGIGFREGNLFIDLGYIYTETKEFYQPYTLNNQDVPGSKINSRSNNFVLTIGYKFDAN